MHFLFGIQAQRKGLTILTVTAKAEGTVPDGARGAAAGPKHTAAKRVEIGGREFWKGESQEKTSGGKMRGVTFATSSKGFILEFVLLSFDPQLADELQHSIESVTFFEPAKAKEIAGPDSHPYSPAPQSSNANAAPIPTSKRIGNLDLGTISRNTYTNNALGLSYEFPAGWVVADRSTQHKVIEAGHQVAWGNDPEAAREHVAMEQCSRVLLWVSEHPEGTKTDEVDPLIAILAVDPGCFPAAYFPKSIDDRDAIMQISREMVRSFQGTAFGKGATTARALQVAGRLVIDVSSTFTLNVPNRQTPLPVFTALDITTAGDYWVMWMFMSPSQAGLDELKSRNIHFLHQ